MESALNSKFVNLPSKQIRYLHPIVVNNMLQTMQLNQEKSEDLLKYIHWLNVNHKIDSQWFKINKILIQTYNIPIIHFLRKGFQRLATDKNVPIIKKHFFELLDIIQLVKNFLYAVKPSCTFKNFLMKFIQPQAFKMQNNILKDYQKNIPVKLNKYQKDLYSFVYDLKQIKWNCKRKMKMFDDQQEFPLQDETKQFQFQQIQKTYKTISNYIIAKKFNLFQLKFLEDNYKRYKEIKMQYNDFITKCNEIRSIIIKNMSQNQEQTPFDSSTLEKQTTNNPQLSNLNCYQQKKCEKSLCFSNDNSVQQIQQITFKEGKQKQKINSTIQSQQLGDKKTNQLQVSTESEIINDRLCCRDYFILRERVPPQSRDIEYKNYGFPWIPNLQAKIGKTICSFLNSHGGNIYIGIQQNEKFIRRVIGHRYSEADKEQLYKSVRQIVQTIKPNIISNSLYQVSFIPVKSKQSNQTRGQTLLKHTYVVKISVHQGIQSRIYTFLNRSTNADEVFFRTQNQVLCYRNIHQILQIQRQRLTKEVVVQKLYPHQNPCSNKMFQQLQKKVTFQKRKPLKTSIQLHNSKNNQLNSKICPQNSNVYHHVISQIQRQNQNNPSLKSKIPPIIVMNPLQGKSINGSSYQSWNTYQSWGQNMPNQMTNNYSYESQFNHVVNINQKFDHTVSNKLKRKPLIETSNNPISQSTKLKQNQYKTTSPKQRNSNKFQNQVYNPSHFVTLSSNSWQPPTRIVYPVSLHNQSPQNIYQSIHQSIQGQNSQIVPQERFLTKVCNPPWLVEKEDKKNQKL